MKKVYKIIITFAIAAITPTIAWIVFLPPIALILIFVGVISDPSRLVGGTGSMLPSTHPSILTSIFVFIFVAIVIILMVYFYAFGFAIVVFAVSYGHLLFFGIPTFLVANHLKIIRWYSVLPASFMIGAAPYVILLATLIQQLSFVGYLGGVFIMGMFGLSAGLTFWVLWRYWVCPENYSKKTSIKLPNQEQTLSINPPRSANEH